MFTTCAIHYNFDLSSVIRFTGGNYTNAHLNAESIINTLSSAGCDQKLMDELKIIPTAGCPAYFNATSSQENFDVFHQYGKHSTITKNIAKVMKTMNKEVQHSFVIPFPDWVIPLCPNIHLTPNGILVKLGKNDRLIWHGSFLPCRWSVYINTM